MATTLKELFFNKQSMKRIGEQIGKSFPQFDQKKFMKQIFDDQWNEKELKQRMKHVSQTINNVLDKPYLESIGILLDVNDKLDSSFVNMIFPEYVSMYGLDYLDESMFALQQLTSKSSSEFAVRFFIQKYGMDAMQYMYRWSKDEDYHVRRLSCEGCRPLLPWSFKLPQFVNDPIAILPILDRLKEDPELYVQKSVGNNLNDISKNHPELVLKICEEWKMINNKGTQFIVKKACRTLLKNGNQKALDLFGVGDKESIKVTNLIISEKEIRIGSQFSFSFQIEDIEIKPSSTQNSVQVNQKRLSVVKIKGTKNNKNIQQQEKDDDEYQPKAQKQKPQVLQSEESEDDEEIVKQNGIRIEYKIDYLKQNGTHSSKIFMLKNQYILPNQKITLEGSQKVQQLTTRKHYPGVHYLSIVVNGIEKAKVQFKLLKEKN